MANSVTKIYEVKTLGYTQLMTELKSIEAEFAAIKKVKQELNALKIPADDALQLAATNLELKKAEIRIAELRLEKQKLISQAKIINQIRQEEINQSKQVAAATKDETGSLNNLISKQKELYNLLKTLSPSGRTAAPSPVGQTIDFNGQKLSFQQGVALYRQLGAEAKLWKNEVNGVSTTTKTLTDNMLNMGNIGQKINNTLSNGFSTMKGQLSQMIFLYTGWFAAFREAGKLISENVKLSDTFADLQIRIKGTSEDVDVLFESLKKIDTRTSLKDLVDIASVVSKKGVAKEEVAGLTAEFDKLNVVLGKEIGDPASATASIIKLITIFNDDKHVTAERVEEIGTSLFKLTTSGVATGEFLVNFAERVGAVRGITGLTLPSILGMGAALQQLGQRTEVAGTAAVQLTTKIFSDIPKFAQAAGKSIQDFRALLDKDPFEALLAVADGLKAIPTDELESEFEGVVAAFGEVGVVGARIKAVLGDIATNGAFVRERMNQAKVSTLDYANATAAAELKQHTFAATLDRTKKALETLGTNKSVQVVLAAIASGILFLISSLNVIIPIILAYAAIWAVANASMIIARASIIATNIAITAQYAAIVIQQTFMKAYTAAILLFTNATGAATIAVRVFTAVLRTPIGFVIATLATLAALFATLKASAQGTTEALRKKAEADRINQEITERANIATAEQISKYQSLVDIVTSTKTSYDTSRLALEQLIGMNDRFSVALDGNVINLNKLKIAMKDIRAEIELNARSEAAASLAGEKYKDYLQVVSTRQTLERKLALAPKETVGFTRSVPTVTLEGISDIKGDSRRLLFGALKADQHGDISIAGVTYNSKELFDNLKAKEEEAFNNYKAYSDASSTIQIQVNEETEKRKKKGEELGKITLQNQIDEAAKQKLSPDELEKLIKNIQAELGKLKEGDVKIAELKAKRDVFQKRLDELNDKKEKKVPAFRGSRIGGVEKDDLAELDALLKLELANREAEFSALQIDHRATLAEEVKFTTDMAEINQRYLAKKIARLESEKSLNAKEKQQLAEYKKDVQDIELASIKTIQNAKDREFERRRSDLKKILDNQINEINLRTEAIQGDASLSAGQRAQAKLDGDNEILVLQEQFNGNIDVLEKELNQKSVDNLKEGSKTKQEIIRDTIELFNAAFKDAGTAANQIADEFRIRAADKVLGILRSGDGPRKQARDILNVQDQLSRDLLASETAQLAIELELYKKGVSLKLKSEADYQAALKRYQEANTALVKANIEAQMTQYQKFIALLKDFADGFLENVLGIKKYTDAEKKSGQDRKDAEAEAGKLAKQAIDESIQGHFDRLNAEVDAEEEVQKRRLDLQKEQQLARAQSKAEEESINKQFAAKAEAVERKAAEDRKKIALKQIAIDYAVAVVKSLAQYGLPLALLPIAAATALYFVQRSNISRQQFEEGGYIPTKEGGEIRGRTHRHGGVKFNYEAQDKELAIVVEPKDNRVHTIKGTARQIASTINQLGGGKPFSPGGTKFADGGFLGSSFPAPIYTPSNNNNTDELRADFKAYAKSMDSRIDKLKVHVVTREITDAQNKQVIQNQIGTL